LHPTDRDWPANPPGCVFLAQAFEDYGRQRFGAAWTGFEARTSRLQPLPSRMDAANWADWANAQSMLQFAQPARAIELCQMPSLRQRWTKTTPEWTDADWSTACAGMDRIIEERHPAVERGETVQRELTELFLTGRRKTVCRPVGGGPVRALSAEEWGVDDVRGRFLFCKTGWPDVYRPPSVADAAWIFVEHDVTERTTKGAHEPPEAERYSPYIKAALAAIRELDIREDNQPKLAAVQETIGDAFRSITGMELTGRLKKALATVVRWPDAQRGRAGTHLKG